MFAMMRPFLPTPPEGVGSPFAWGNEEYVRGFESMNRWANDPSLETYGGPAEQPRASVS